VIAIEINILDLDGGSEVLIHCASFRVKTPLFLRDRDPVTMQSRSFSVIRIHVIPTWISQLSTK
jgi:hypothetical protein